MLISISESDGRPIYAQIAAAVKDQIREGSLKPSDELPGVRELASSLGVNLHTVHRAYQTLKEEGIIYLRLGQRARIAPLRQSPVSRERIESELVPRIGELITEAFHLGVSGDEFRSLVDEVLESKGEGGSIR